MELSYCMMDPTGNITALVESEIAVEAQPAVGAALLRLEPRAEQVGFILPGDAESEIGLRMAGGEFCGNATLSTAAWYCRDRKLPAGERLIRVRVSGVGVLAVDAVWDPCRGFTGTVTMPRPLSVENAPFRIGDSEQVLPVVRFDGIRHFIAPPDLPHREAETAIRQSDEATGLIFLDRETRRMEPLVWVPQSDSLYWEHSCASGSSAAAVVLAREAGAPVRAELQQPGGTISVFATPEGEIRLTGSVIFESEHKISLQDADFPQK